ncbi:MAG: hypothetical protein NT062_09155 [Proteobacteria bacterium]|nr:hypothetical protein [Pseudomonadota bacterium]
MKLLIATVATLVACKGHDDVPAVPAVPATPGTPGTPNPTPPPYEVQVSGVSATIKLDGDKPFDGPVPGRIICMRKAGFAFESQGHPKIGEPRVNLRITRPKDGTFALLDQYAVMTGKQAYPADAPAVEAAMIETASGQYVIKGGTLILAGNGASGSLTGAAAIPGMTGHDLTVAFTWKDCP